jgi:hypothetical protein
MDAGNPGYGNEPGLPAPPGKAIPRTPDPVTMSTINEAIEAAERALGERAKHFQKLERQLAAARRDLAKNRRPIALLKTLIADLVESRSRDFPMRSGCE